MAKSQPTKTKVAKGAEKLNGTKAGRVVKSTDTPKAKSKVIAKSAAVAAVKGLHQSPMASLRSLSTKTPATAIVTAIAIAMRRPSLKL
jgi:hypothetical protein